MGERPSRAEEDTPRDRRHWKRVARRYYRYLAHGNWSAENWAQYGFALKASGELNTAAHAYAMAVSLEIDNLSDAHLQTGHLHQVQGNTQKAVQSYKSALKFDPENLAAANELRALGVLDEELAPIIEGAKQDRHDIGLHPSNRVLAAKLKSGPPIRRRKWGPALAAVIIVLCLAWSGVSMLVGPPLEIVDDAYLTALAEARRLMDWENGEAEAAARKAAEGKTVIEVAARRAAEEKVLAEAAARKAAEEKALAEAAARKAAEGKALAEAAARKTAEEKALTEAAARRVAEQKLAAEDARLKAGEEAREAAEVKPKSAAELREQAERAEVPLVPSEQDRKKVQVALNSLGHEIPTATGYFGPRTRAMITAWQKKQGLPETGYLDASQLAALYEQAALAKHADETKLDARQQAEKVEAGLNLSEQDRKRVQVALNSLGHEIPTATGYFGPRTRAMITAWQKKQGHPETSYLTEVQLRTLWQQAGPALAKYDQAQMKPKEDRFGTK
jgi:peptidoglycan hydrolase-like protein with peptidoglycan-binding domain